MRIIVETESTSYSFTCCDDIDAEELVCLFKKVMFSLGYHIDTIKKYLGGEEE